MNNTNTILSVDAPTRDECIRIITEKHGSNYVLDHWKQTVIRRGIFRKATMGVSQYYHLVNSAMQYSPMQNYGSTPSNSAYQIPNSMTVHAQNEFLDTIDATNSKTIKTLTDQLQQVQDNLEKKFGTMLENYSSHTKHANVTKIENILYDNDFTKTYIEKIVERINKEFSVEALEDYNSLRLTVLDWIAADIKIAEPRPMRPPKVVVIVGPTGVGKTTTLVKLAAKVALKARRESSIPPKIKMLTIDVTRVAAMEQLKHWAEIINSTVDKAERPGDLELLYKSYCDISDYIFIDTSGYSPNDYENIAKMRMNLEVKNMVSDTYLAVVAGINSKNLETILRNYETFNFQSVIVTKCDESSTYGNLISVLAEKNKAISYITNGQDVPATIEKASKIFFLRKLQGFGVDDLYLNERYGSEEE